MIELSLLTALLGVPVLLLVWLAGRTAAASGTAR